MGMVDASRHAAINDRIADLWEAISEIRKTAVDLEKFTVGEALPKQNSRICTLERFRESVQVVNRKIHSQIQTLENQIETEDELQQIEDGDRKTQPDGQPTCGITANAPESSCVSYAEVDAAMRVVYGNNTVYSDQGITSMRTALEQFLANR